MKKEPTAKEIATYEFYKIIGERVLYYRKQNYLTQEQLGSILGISRVAINCIEQGKQRLSVYNYGKFCQVFNIGLNEIIPTEEFDFTKDVKVDIPKESKLTKRIKAYRLEVVNSGLTPQQLEGAELVFIGVLNMVTPSH